MNRREVTKEQAKRIHEALYPPTNYLFRLRRRMEQRGFPPDDPLYALVDAAYNAIHHLGVEVHYLTCDGVGEPRRPDESEGQS